MRIPNGAIEVQEGGSQPVVCVELVTSTSGGIAADLPVSVFVNTDIGIRLP